MVWLQVLKLTEGFLGRSIVEPNRGSDIWVVILKFKNVHCLNAWKVGDIQHHRKQWRSDSYMHLELRDGSYTAVA